MSLPEVLLWQRLKSSANPEFKIRRQYPVLEKFVVDFFYVDQQIAFEIDGQVHSLKSDKDAVRQKEIEALGIVFVRIPAKWVLRNPDEVVRFIFDICSGEIRIEDLEEGFR